jgi:hypothetical protein
MENDRHPQHVDTEEGQPCHPPAPQQQVHVVVQAEAVVAAISPQPLSSSSPSLALCIAYTWLLGLSVFEATRLFASGEYLRDTGTTVAYALFVITAVLVLLLLLGRLLAPLCQALHALPCNEEPRVRHDRA